MRHIQNINFEGECVDFIKSNILLVGLALGSAIMLLLPMFKKSAGGVPNVSTTEAVTLINRANALVLDVRDDAEYESGHIAEATHIPVASLEARLAELKKYKTKKEKIQGIWSDRYRCIKR